MLTTREWQGTWQASAMPHWQWAAVGALSALMGPDESGTAVGEQVISWLQAKASVKGGPGWQPGDGRPWLVS